MYRFWNHPLQILMLLLSIPIIGSDFSVANGANRGPTDPVYQTLLDSFEGEYWIDRENCTTHRKRQTYVKLFLRRRKAPALDSFNADFEGRFGSGGPHIYVGQSGKAHELSEPLLYESLKNKVWWELEPTSYRTRRTYLTVKPGLIRETGKSWAWDRSSKTRKLTSYWSRSYERNSDGSVTLKISSRVWDKKALNHSSCRFVPRTQHNSKDQYDKYRKNFTGRFLIRRDHCNLFADHNRAAITLTVGHSYLYDVIQISAYGGKNKDPNQGGTFITIGDEGRFSLPSKPWQLADLIKTGWFFGSYESFKAIDKSLINTMNYEEQLQFKEKSFVEAQTYWAHPYGDKANRKHYWYQLKELSAPTQTSVLFKRTTKKYDEPTAYGSCLFQRE